jgi:hypothetical protein
LFHVPSTQIALFSICPISYLEIWSSVIGHSLEAAFKGLDVRAVPGGL